MRKPWTVETFEIGTFGTPSNNKRKGRYKMAKKKYIYKVYHGWAFPEYVTEFKSMKKAVAFIEKQEDPDNWCFDKVIYN